MSYDECEADRSVPVDQGVSAQTFIKKRASRIAAKAAAEASAKKSSTSASDESDDRERG